MTTFKTFLLAACVLFVGVRAESATLTITTTGAHTGNVSVTPTAQLCRAMGGGETCTFTIANGTHIFLAANSPSTPGIFSSGTGDAAACATSTCNFTLNGDSSIVTSFNPGTYPYVQVVLAGDGKGEVSFNNTQCQNFELGYSGCKTYYGAGSEVTLAARAPGTFFMGFSAGTADASACGTTTPCVFTLTTNSAVTASFAALTSVAVLPSAATINVGQMQAFTASGTFTNGASRSLLSGTGLWKGEAPMSSPRFGVAAGVLDQRVYVVGGVAGGPLSAIEAYNPVSQSWTTLFSDGTPLASMPTPREGLAAAVLGSELYTVGGHTSGGSAIAAVEAYSALTNTWAIKAPMPTARAAVAAGVVGNVLYVVGGGENGAPLDALEAYNPISTTWTTLAPMPTPRSYLAVAVANGLLYAIGGDLAGTVEAYDPATNTWTAKASLPTPRSALGAGAIDGLIYAVGGSGSSYAGTVEVYNPATDSWATLWSMNTPRDQFSLAVLDGRLFVAGGKTDATNTSLVATLEAFRPSEMTWWSSNSGVATVNQYASATGMSSGTATIIGRAVGPIDCGTTSSCASVTVSGGAPGQPAAPIVSGSGNFTTFSWSAPSTGSPITSYTLVVRLVPGGPVVTTLPVGNVTTFSVNGPNGTFLVSVQATNAVGSGPESLPATVTLPLVSAPPGAPGNLAATLSGTTAYFTWTPPTTGGPPTGYQLLVSLISGGAVIGSVPPGNVTSLAIPGVPPGVFYLRLVATNAAGSGPSSNEVIVNSAGCTLPATPQGLFVSFADGVATAGWNPIAGAESYTVYAQAGGGGPFGAVATVTTAIVNAPVGSGTDVWVSVTANNACGSSPMAPAQRLTVP
ncbi:MAG TPA: kelch repeat-containing protein [Vicinamibacterales bacterium]|nr:kelch repeat-containing protein [Vicinamibacterales bacterium]